VSVVMPAHNEAGLLDQTLKELVGELRERDLTFEVLVVENGSSDTTLADARAFAIADPVVRVLTRPRADYGEAMRVGILAASRDVVVVFDVDYYDADFVDRVLPALTTADGPAIVVGSKRAPGTTDTRPWPRRAITAGFASLLRYGFGLQVSDTHGMKAMRRATVVPIVERCWSGTDLFDTELVLRADRAGLPVAEVPVTVEERRPSRTPILRRVLRTMVGLVRLRVQLWKEDRR
jgi:glycosyltransferase involved in cell wall biosynthesis